MGPLDLLTEHIDELKDSLMNSYIIVGSDDSLGLTNFVFWMIICCIIVLFVVLLSKRKLKLIPDSKFVSTIEMGYAFVRNDIAKGVIGPNFKKHVSFMASLFFFILVANFVGLIPGSKACTGSISITWALAAVAFVYFNYAGVKAKGGLTYLKSICPAGLPKVLVPIIWSIETMSLFLRAFTLAVRLYGNMLAGHIVLGIFAILAGVFADFAITNMQYVSMLPSVAWILMLVAMYGLEVLVAFLQSYVFVTLTSVYVSLAEANH